MARTKTLNKYDLSGDYGIGYFTDGTPFYFDKEDYDTIKDLHWCKGNNSVIANIRVKGQGTILRCMHRLIMLGDKYDTARQSFSFKDGNYLNCRKENLAPFKPRGRKSKNFRVMTDTTIYKVVDKTDDKVVDKPTRKVKNKANRIGHKVEEIEKDEVESTEEVKSEVGDKINDEVKEEVNSGVEDKVKDEVKETTEE